MYKEMIEVFDSEIFTLSKYLEDKEMELLYGKRFRKMIKALSKAITLAKAFDSVDGIPEKLRGLGLADESSFEFGKTIGFNQAHDIFKPLIVKLKLELEEEKVMGNNMAEKIHNLEAENTKKDMRIALVEQANSAANKIIEEEINLKTKCMERIAELEEQIEELKHYVYQLKAENGKLQQLTSLKGELDICKFKFIAESENLKTVQQQLQTIKDNLNSKELKEFIWERCEADDNRVKEIISFIRQKVTGDKE